MASPTTRSSNVWEINSGDDVLQVTGQGGIVLGGISSTGAGFGALTTSGSVAGTFAVTTYGAVCDGAHLAADTAGIKAAINAAIPSGGTVVFPVGTCQFDNSAGPFTINAFNGQLTGYGKISSIAFSTLANDGFDINNSTSLNISNLSFSFTPNRTTRGGGYPVNINACSNVVLETVYFNNGNLSALRIGNSNNIHVVNVTATNFLANGIFTLNNNDMKFFGTTCSNNGDACEEYSFYDSGTQASCSRISSTGMSSTNDASGILINSCSNVSVSNFNIINPGRAGITVAQDSSTTTTKFPDDIQITNGTIFGAGYGTNALNINTAIGLSINILGSPATNQNINISNVIVNHNAGRGLQLADSNTVNLAVTGLRIHDAGNGNTSATGEAIYLDGNVVKLSSVYVSNAGTYSLRNHLGTFIEASDFTSVNPNQLNTSVNCVINEVNGGYFVMKNITVLDSFAGANRSNIINSAGSGVQKTANYTSLCTVTCTPPSF